MRLTRVADTLADRTGLGDAVGGALVAATGLDGGLVGFTVTTAISSLPELVVLVIALVVWA